MNKPEADLNARVHAYLVFSDFLEVLSSRVGGTLDLETDPAHLLWTIVTDTSEDMLADIARAKMTVEEDGSFSIQSDVIDLVDKIKSTDLGLPDSDNDLQIMMSVIIERLEDIEDKIKNMNEKGNREH